jgi:hypothetical protein
MKIRYYQERVYNWQRDVAAQPVTKTPTQRDPEFCKQQLGFAKSEWFEEYLVHASLYHSTLGNLPKSRIDGLLKKIDQLRSLVADDIGDVAFTILGLLNAYGVTLDRVTFGRATAMAVYPLEVRISEFLENVGSEDKVSEADAKSALLDLMALSTYFSINFWAALEAVCVSNDTKLWTLPEVHDNELKIQSLGWTETKVAGVTSVRCHRVKNSAGKLIKSPSFVEPDLKVALTNFVSLT